MSDFGCRPLEKGQVAKAVLVRCPVCDAAPDQAVPPALFEEPGRVWRGWSPRYVCVAVERDAAAEALLDHLNRAHDSRRPEYIQGFDTNFEPVRKLDGRATH